jgi:hypothetical protein
MNLQRVLLALTVLNGALLIFLLAHTAPIQAQGVASVLRGRGLEIVDDDGRVRASITVIPADPSYKMPDGARGYPETVLLRLITSQGRPNVKLQATEDGAGIGLGGDSDPTYASLGAQGGRPSLKLVNGDGRQHELRP